MSRMPIRQTKWADHGLLTELGIFEDVNNMFTNMGLGGLFHMAETTYTSETKQFLATLDFYDDSSLDISHENRGRLSFKIDNKEYAITIAQITAVFHFPQGGEVYTPAFDNEEAQGVWTAIAQGAYSKGVSKATKIRHPAIRFVHKFLANTLYSRRENGAVKEEELALITEGIKPYLVSTAVGDIRGQPKRINFAHLLCNRFLFYQDWITTHKDSTPTISMGGLVTPILRACNVPLEETGRR